MTVRMVGEKLAREARGTAGADAAGKTDRLKAAVQECRTAAAQIQQEAKSKAGASADDLNTLIAEVSWLARNSARNRQQGALPPCCASSSTSPACFVVRRRREFDRLARYQLCNPQYDLGSYYGTFGMN